MSRWRSACRNCRAIAPTSSASCAKSSATAPTCASSATVSCSSREVFFDTGQAVLNARRAGRARQARGRASRTGQADPAGHPLGAAGRRPYRRAADRQRAQFPSNWDLSAARAISVVQYLISKGIPPQRLVAAGLRRIPAARHRQHRGGLPPQPPHRAEADGAVSDGRCGRSDPVPRGHRGRGEERQIARGGHFAPTPATRTRHRTVAAHLAAAYPRHRFCGARELVARTLAQRTRAGGDHHPRRDATAH